MNRKIKLYGSLAEKYTAEPFTLNVNDTPTLISLLDANFPGMKHDFTKERVAVVLKDGEHTRPIDNIYAGDYGNHPEIHIAAGMPFAYEAAVIWVAEYASISSAAATAIVNAAISFVVSISISYISQSLADKPQENSSKDERKSWLFDQGYNLEGMGQAIPLCYGRFKTGSMVVSSSLDTVKNAIAISDHLQLTNGAGSITGNFLENDVSPTALTVVDFHYRGVTQLAGTTITTAGVSLRINADGSYVASCTSATTGSSAAYYKVSNGETDSVGTVVIDITDPIDAYGGGTGGDGGPGDGGGTGG